MDEKISDIGFFSKIINFGKSSLKKTHLSDLLYPQIGIFSKPFHLGSSILDLGRKLDSNIDPYYHMMPIDSDPFYFPQEIREELLTSFQQPKTISSKKKSPKVISPLEKEIASKTQKQELSQAESKTNEKPIKLSANIEESQSKERPKIISVDEVNIKKTSVQVDEKHFDKSIEKISKVVEEQKISRPEEAKPTIKHEIVEHSPFQRKKSIETKEPEKKETPEKIGTEPERSTPKIFFEKISKDSTTPVVPSTDTTSDVTPREDTLEPIPTRRPPKEEPFTETLDKKIPRKEEPSKETPSKEIPQEPKPVPTPPKETPFKVTPVREITPKKLPLEPTQTRTPPRETPQKEKPPTETLKELPTQTPQRTTSQKETSSIKSQPESAPTITQTDTPSKKTAPKKSVQRKTPPTDSIKPTISKTTKQSRKKLDYTKTQKHYETSTKVDSNIHAKPITTDKLPLTKNKVTKNSLKQNKKYNYARAVPIIKSKKPTVKTIMENTLTPEILKRLNVLRAQPESTITETKETVPTINIHNLDVRVISKRPQTKYRIETKKEEPYPEIVTTSLNRNYLWKYKVRT